MDIPESRKVQVDALRGAVSTGTSVSVIGLPGSGRSAVIQHARRELEDDGWTVTGIRGCGERPLDALVLGGFVPPPGPTLTSVAVDRLTAAVGGRRSVLIIEDADDVDDASAAIIGAVVARHGTPVIASLRPPYPGTRSVDRMFGGHESTAVWLPPLRFEGVHGLILEVLEGDVEPDVAARVYALSGGLPGLVQAIVTEARQAGNLTLGGGRWDARYDLWTPALAVVVSRLLAGLCPSEVQVAHTLALLGPTGVSTVRRLAGWEALVALDERGLVRFVEADGQHMVALFPPLLDEHLRRAGHSARGREALERIDDVLSRDDDPPMVADVRLTSGGTPSDWFSLESASVLGRLLRDHARTRVLVSRDTWEQERSSRAAVSYLDALLAAGAQAHDIDGALRAAREREDTDSRDGDEAIDAWEAGYRGLVRRDVAGAQVLLSQARSSSPPATPLFDAIKRHLSLVVHEGSIPELVPPVGDPRETEVYLKFDLPRHVTQTSRTTYGELQLTCGRGVDAQQTFTKTSTLAVVPRVDSDSLTSLAMLSYGDIDGAVARSRRLLDTAEHTLDQSQIEPHGYVVALGLLFQGRLRSLGEHLTSLFALNSPAPLRPTTRAGILTLGSLLSVLEGNLPTARSMAKQVESLGLRGGPYPLSRPGPSLALVEVAAGEAPGVVTAKPWGDIDTLVNHGFTFIATVDATWLAELAVDAHCAANVATKSATCQGTLLPQLGRYLDARAQGSAQTLLTVADDLHSDGLLLHAALARAHAVRALRVDGDRSSAIREASRLQELVEVVNGELDPLIPWLSASRQLTSREREVARLIAAGHTNREVAQRLTVSERTVDNHLYRIFRKLGVSSRDQIGPLL